MRFVSSIAFVAALVVIAGASHAQSRSRQPSFQRDRLQIVPAALPGPTPGLGGVPAAIPQIQPLGQPLSQPQYKPMQVAPWPGVVVTPQNSPQNGQMSPSRPPRGNSPSFDGRPFNHNPNRGGTSISGSGLTVDGSYSDDRWKLHLHLGSDAFRRPLCRPYGHNNPIVGAYPYWWGGWGDDYRSYYGNRYGTIYGFYSQPDPAIAYIPPPPPVTEAVTPSTNRELGDTYLRGGDARAAIKAYQAHLKQYPGDEEAMRALGLALIDAGQTAEGVAMIAMAYRAEPLLADRAIAPNAFRDGAAGLARDVAKVSIYANRVRADSAWLALAVLIQAQGRDNVARMMVERAKGAGLESGVADRLFSALR